MKHTSPTLLTLAALVIAPAAYALDVNDADVKLGLSLQLQVRAEVSAARDYNNNNYNVAEGSVSQQDAVDFYIRRARLGFKGTYKDAFKFAFILRADAEDKTTAGVGRTPEVQQAFVGREFKQGNLTHYVQAGLDYAFFNGTSAIASSNTALLINARATEQAGMLAPRGVGLKYQLKAPYVTWGVDIQNNIGDSVNSDSTNGHGEGMCYTTRVHITPENEWKISTPAESYLGAPGKGILVSLEYGRNVDDVIAEVATPTATAGTVTAKVTDRQAWGSEVYFHYDAVSALAEWREVVDSNTNSTTDVLTTVKKRIYLIQAGYAMKCPMVEGAVVEPALRFQRIDLDRENATDVAFKGDYGSAEYGNSGKQIDLGVNYYLNKANTKFALDYAYWRAEDGDGQANILRAQMQLYF